MSDAANRSELQAIPGRLRRYASRIKPDATRKGEGASESPRGERSHPGPTASAARIRRWLSWPFYVIGTAIIDLADAINPDEEPFSG